MTQRDSFDDILDAAIDALRSGASRDHALAAAGASAATMGGLLDTARLLSSPPRVPGPMRLADHYDIVRAAVERAQLTRSQMLPSDDVAKTPWWSRRFRVASLGVPAGIVAALALFGFAAAAGGIATTGVGQDIAGSVRPGWVSDLVETGNDDGERRGDPPGLGPDGENGGNGGNGGAPLSPGADNGPQSVVLSGTVSDVVGGNFTLTAADGEFHVQTDANTVINGAVLEGASATIEGELTADRNLHAKSLTASGGELPAGPPGQDNGQKPDDAGPPDTPENVPGNEDKTPPAAPPPRDDGEPGSAGNLPDRTPRAQGTPNGGQGNEDGQGDASNE